MKRFTVDLVDKEEETLIIGVLAKHRVDKHLNYKDVSAEELLREDFRDFEHDQAVS